MIAPTVTKRARVAAGEAGLAGGVEVLAFGVLIFVVGTLLVANTWAVVDAKLATGAAAREAARTYVEAPSAEAGAGAAQRAAREAVAASGRDAADLRLRLEGGPAFVRCARITFVAEVTVPAVSLPFHLGFGRGVRVRSHHSEIVDPLRSGLGRRNRCGY